MRRARKTSLIVLVLTALASSAHAGTISDLFSDGLLDVKWGTKKEDVEKALPGGKSSKLIRESYKVKDSRKVLGVERIDENITFGFSTNGELCQVEITFQGGPIKSNKLFQIADETFGQHLLDSDSKISNRDDFSSEEGYRWPTDNGITVTLIQRITVLSHKMLLMIDHCQAITTANKKDLGF